MTIETQQGKKSWIGDGSTTTYPYPYPFIEALNIEVYLDGIKQSSGFSVQNKPDYNDGANIIFDNPPGDGVIIVIRRNIPTTQEISYPENGEFPAKSHERALDKLTMIAIDNDNESLKINPGTPEDFNPTFPLPLANKALKITADGKGFAMSDYDPDIALVATEDFKDAAEAAALAAGTSETNAKASETSALNSKNDAILSASLAKDWATKMDGKVEDIDYSSKYYANNASELNITLTDNYNQYKVDLENEKNNGLEALENEKNNGLEALANASNALRQTQITNCILEAPNGVAQWSGVTPTGSLTNNQGVVSGFSESNYLTINKIPETVNSFEMEWCVTTGSTTSSDIDQCITGQPDNYTSPQFQIPHGTNKFELLCGSSSSAWGQVIRATNTVNLNTTYWLRALWNGTTIYFYLKTSKEADWELQGTTQQSYVEWSEVMKIGIDNIDEGGDHKAWQGSIDLSQSYIKINGEIFWQGNDLGFNQFRAKQGLKTLIPNGRNEDKTLKNIENTLSQDSTFTHYDNVTGSYWAAVGETASRLRKTSWEYKNDENYIIGTLENVNVGQKAPFTMIGDMEVKNGNIVSFTPYNPVSLVSWDDESYKKSVYGYILPDYTAAIDMGLTASSPYTAPCDGWVIGSVGHSGSGKYYIKVNDVSVYYEPNDYVSAAMPVKAKDIVSSTNTPYNIEGNIKFYPCKGAYNV